MTVVDPIPLMIRYLAGGEDLSNDDRELLLFALYCETKGNPSGLVQSALKQMSYVPAVTMPVEEKDAKPEA